MSIIAGLYNLASSDTLFIACSVEVRETRSFICNPGTAINSREGSPALTIDGVLHVDGGVIVDIYPSSVSPERYAGVGHPPSTI